MDRQSERGAIGGSSSLGKTDTTKFHYNTSAVQVGNQIRDGDEFVLLVRSKQGEGFQAWSSGDQETTPQIVAQAMRQLDLQTT